MVELNARAKDAVEIAAQLVEEMLSQAERLASSRRNAEPGDVAGLVVAMATVWAANKPR